MRKLLLIIYILLPLILLGLGSFFVFGPWHEQPIWFGVGQSIIASAIFSLVMLVGTWADRIADREDESTLVNKMAEHLDWQDKFQNRQDEYLNRVDMFADLGIRRVHDNRYIKETYQKYQNIVSEHLDLLGMSLMHFQQDVDDETLLRWVSERPHLEIRLLLMNPSSPYCNERDREEDAPEGEIADYALRLTKRVLNLEHPRIHVRWYNTLPMANVFRLDDIVFIGTYLVGVLSRLTTTFEQDVHKPLAKQFLKHFDDLWTPPKGREWWTLVPTLADVEAARHHIARQHDVYQSHQHHPSEQSDHLGGAQSPRIHADQSGAE